MIRSEENRKGNNNPRFSIELCIQNEGLESKSMEIKGNTQRLPC